MALYLVATPIGHLGDITTRAREVLSRVGVVLAEDTRRAGALLSHLGLARPLVRYDDHVHDREGPRLAERLAGGEDMALVTDAGTPGLSDPGSRLAALVVERGGTVVPVPGASALLAALAGAGLPWDQFTFLGFLPRRPGRLKRTLAAAGTDRTVVFYESPHRVVAALEAALSVWGNAPAAVARELTKMHEEFVRGTLDQVIGQLKARPRVRGEVTVVISPQGVAHTTP